MNPADIILNGIIAIANLSSHHPVIITLGWYLIFGGTDDSIKFSLRRSENVNT